MTTHKQMNDVADRMANALKRLTDGLAKDGMALEGFVDAINIQEEWANIKLKRSIERFISKSKVQI